MDTMDCRWIIALVHLLSWKIVFATDGHFLPCAKDWLQHGLSCYQFNGTAVVQAEATSTCQLHKAHLVFVETEAENQIVKDYTGQVTSSMWLGAHYNLRTFGWHWGAPNRRMTQHPRTYVTTTNWAFNPRTRTEVCSMVMEDGLWSPVNCTATLPFLCERPAPCKAGWYRADCNAQCHCYKSDLCNQQDGACPRGCSPGWTGAACNKENPMPEASFHCLKKTENVLQVDITVNAKDRYYQVVQAVNEEGEALHCNLGNFWPRDGVYYITLSLHDAFLDASNSTDNMETNVTNNDEMSNTSSPEVTQSGPGSDGSTTSASAAEDTVTVKNGGKKGNQKRDVQAVTDTENSLGEECVASRTHGGNVTWLIEFKEFPGVLTGNDVTVVATCDLDAVDSLEPSDILVDDSEKMDPMTAGKMSVEISAYFSDLYSGERVEHFHLGQQLQLHVNVKGLTDSECAFPHSCVARPQNGEGREISLLNEYGCPVQLSPLRTLYADDKGDFISNPFPAFSLGSRTLVLDCQVNIERTEQRKLCQHQNSCRQHRS